MRDEPERAEWDPLLCKRFECDFQIVGTKRLCCIVCGCVCAMCAFDKVENKSGSKKIY